MKNLLAAFVLTAAGSAAAITYCSPAGDDAAAGTPEAPKCSIQKILGANPSETVVLLPGTYHLSDPSQKVEGENGALHSNGAGVLRSATGNPADVVIDGDGQSECVRIAGRFRLEGLTFTGGALMFHTGSASGGLVANCRFVGNAVAGYGGAVNARFHLDGSDDAKGIVLRNCLFADNRASKQGGALYIIGQQSAKPDVTNVVENCTLAGNTAPENADGHGLYQKFGNFRCVNTLFGPSQTVVTGNNRPATSTRPAPSRPIRRRRAAATARSGPTAASAPTRSSRTPTRATTPWPAAHRA